MKIQRKRFIDCPHGITYRNNYCDIFKSPQAKSCIRAQWKYPSKLMTNSKKILGFFFLPHPTYLNKKFHKVAQTENNKYTRANVLWVWKILEWEINYSVWDQDNIQGQETAKCNSVSILQQAIHGEQHEQNLWVPNLPSWQRLVSICPFIIWSRDDWLRDSQIMHNIKRLTSLRLPDCQARPSRARRH